MEQFNLNSMRLLAGACGLFTILALTPVGVAQQAAAVQGNNVSAAAPATAAPSAKTGLAAQAAAKPAEEQEAAAPGKPGNEGIKVHGHWVLQVKNADGTLGERREFDNSLVTGGLVASGDQILAALLSGNVVAGDPGILLVQASQPMVDQSRYCLQTNQNIYCYLMTTATSPLVNNFGITGGAGELQAVGTTQNGLNVAVHFTPTVSWVLSGNFTVPSGLTYLSVVQTALPLCFSPTSSVNSNFSNSGTTDAFAGTSGDLSADFAPKACTGNVLQDSMRPAILTSTAIPSNPVSVTTGQIITVTVTISFS
jgi:hypothetical protein